MKRLTASLFLLVLGCNIAQAMTNSLVCSTVDGDYQYIRSSIEGGARRENASRSDCLVKGEKIENASCNFGHRGWTLSNETVAHVRTEVYWDTMDVALANGEFLLEGAKVLCWSVRWMGPPIP